MVDDTVAQERRDFYVYVIFRLDGSPCYVGKGQRDRWKQHARGSHNPHLRRLYESAGGVLPIAKIREGLPNSEACEIEIALIRAIGRGRNGPLTNRTDGGEGLLGNSPSEETRQKKRLKLAGRKRPPEIGAAVRAAWSNISPQRRLNMRAAQLGHKATDETRLKQSIAGLARYGKTLTDVVRVPKKTKAEVSAAQSARNVGNKYGVGNKRTPEGQAKVAARVSASNRLRVSTPEYRALRRDIAKRMWANRKAKADCQGSLDL